MSPAAHDFSAAAGSKTQTSPRDVTEKRQLADGLEFAKRTQLTPETKQSQFSFDMMGHAIFLMRNCAMEI